MIWLISYEWFFRPVKKELGLRSLTPGKSVMVKVVQYDMVSLAKSKSLKTPGNSLFSFDSLKKSLMGTFNSGIWISGISTMVDMKFSFIPNTGTLTATTLTLSFLLLRSSTRTNILNSFTGLATRKNILASNHRCIKEQNHLEPTTTEQFKKHHMSTQIQSPQSDSKMEELSKSEDEEDTIKNSKIFLKITLRNQIVVLNFLYCKIFVMNLNESW